jgi:hypothetical protein
MGLISQFWGMLFGGGRNVVAETVEVFRENAEAGAARGAAIQTGAMGQFSAEFGQRQRGWFDRFMDGLNRLPRPAMVIGILALFTSAMTNPIWFAERMQGLALVPEPLWWLLGAVVCAAPGKGPGLPARSGGNNGACPPGRGEYRRSAQSAPRQPRCR